MVVDSFLEMYTLLFGWLFYNNLWELLESSGFLLLPFIGMVIDYLIDYKNGVEVGDAEELAQKGLLWEMLIACFVIALCGSPFMNFQATEIVFSPSAMDESATQSSYTIATSDATYGSGLSFSDTPDMVKVPPFWWAVHSLSIGFTHSFMESFPSTLNMRHYLESLKELWIDDPDLTQELNDFKRDCFIPARSKYDSEKPQLEGAFVSDIEDIFDDEGIEDPAWLGSHVLLTIPGYYDSLRSTVNIKGFPYEATRDTEWQATDADVPTYGRPFCDHWWADSGVGLRERVISEAGWLLTANAMVEAALSPVTRQDLLAKILISQTGVHYTPRGYDFSYSNTTQGNNSVTDMLTSTSKNVASLAGGYYERITESVNITIMLNSAPMVQAILIMLVIIFLPFVLLLSKYSIKVVVIVSWALFSLRFFTGCWMLAWWLDQNIIAALFPESGITITVIETGLEGTNRNVLLLYILNYLYIAIPVIFTIVSGWAGFSLMRGIGTNSLMGAGMASAGGKAVGGAMNAAKSVALKKVKK